MGPQQFLFDEQGCPWGRGGKMHVDVFFGVWAVWGWGYVVGVWTWPCHRRQLRALRQSKKLPDGAKLDLSFMD